MTFGFKTLYANRALTWNVIPVFTFSQMLTRQADNIILGVV